MEVLIYNCPGCCELVDENGWNVLHFAFTSRNRKAVEIILENPSLGNLVNEKDHDGNTPFLLDASESFIIRHPKVDMFVFKNDNHTAAHITEVLSPYSWAGRKDLKSFRPSDTIKLQSYRRVFLEKRDEEEEKGSDRVLEQGQNDLLVATLIATVTFAAGIAVLGGFISDKGPDQGSAILTRKAAFLAFIILNGISLILSSLVIYKHMDHRRDPITRIKEIRHVLIYRSLLIRFALFAMIGAFLSATYAVLHSDKRRAATVCGVIAAAAMYMCSPLFNREVLLSMNLSKLSGKRLL